MQQFSQSVSNDLLDIHNLLKTDTSISAPPSTIAQNDLGDFNQQNSNINTSSRKLMETVQDPLSSTIIETYFESSISKESSNVYNSSGEDKSKSHTPDTKIITNTYTNNNSMGQHGMNCVGITSGNSSPNSNFSCTPIESVSSCTPEATLTSELNEIYDSVPILNSIKHSINQDTNDNHQLNNVDADAAEKFFLEQFSIDEELEKIISSPSITPKHSTESPKKKNTITNLSKTFKKRKATHEPTVNESNLRKCFSKLKTNYLNLCQTYNRLLDDYNRTKHQNKELRKALDDAITEKEILENEKDYYLVEREDMKSAIESLLHEVILYRSKNKVKGSVFANRTEETISIQ